MACIYLSANIVIKKKKKGANKLETTLNAQP